MSAVRPVIQTAFVTWSDLACAGGEASIAFSQLADASCHVPSYDPSGPNANVVMFQDDKWTFDGVDDNIAKTTVTFDPSSGEIWDADIELNSAYNAFTTGDEGADYDLQSIVTHEIGHFIGLAHTPLPGATMFADYTEGTTSERTLSTDDIAGACTIYPANRGAACDPTPRGGLSGVCAPASPPASGGCAVAQAEPGSAPTIVAAAIAVAAGARARRATTLLRSATFALAALLLGAFVACGGGSDTATAAATTALCDPASVIFCRCFDDENGSKTCAADGASFGPCLNQETGQACDTFMSTSSSSSSGVTTSSSSSSSGGSGGDGAGGAASTSTAATGGGGASSSSSTSSSSSSTGGAGGATPVGACPGEPLSVAIGNDTAVGATNAPGADDNADRCGGAGAREIVYEVTPMSSGTLTVRVTGVASTDPVLYARTGDCAAGVSLGCVDATGAGGEETLTLEAITATPIWIFVDAKPGAEGMFALSLHLDVGVPGDTCPGNAIAIDPGQTITAGGDTSIAGAQYKGTGTCAASGTKEIVYGVTPSADGMLTVTLTPEFDAQLYARSGSCTSSVTSTQLGCSDQPGAGAIETIAFAVVAATKYSVFADGSTAADAGPYTIAFDLQ